MKVLVILGTKREGSNTLEAVNTKLPFEDFELVDLQKHEIQHDAYTSQKAADDFLLIAKKMAQADKIIFATPVYWYAMSAIMKTFFDRFSDLISSSKTIGRSLAGKDTYLLATGSDKELPEGFEVPFRKTCEYFDMNFMETLYFSMKD